jgi:pimeloyl-ACP methyl ester carboxylesterase
MDVSTASFGELYDRAVADLLVVSVSDERVGTPAGETHLLLAGDTDARPLFVLQGGNVTTPVTLAWVEELADDCRLVAPDTPGEPGLTAARSEEYGRWLVDLLDALGIDAVSAVGISHGAGVLLEAVAYAPDRFESIGLVVPTGFGTGPALALARVVVPSLAYRLWPRRWLLERALAPLFTRPPSALPPVVLDTVATALRTTDVTTGFPGPEWEALRGVDVPALVVAAADDPFFPADTIGPRVRATLSSLREIVTLPDERHFLGPKGCSRTRRELRAFLGS